MDWWVNGPTNQLTNQPTTQPTNQLTNQPSDYYSIMHATKRLVNNPHPRRIIYHLEFVS